MINDLKKKGTDAKGKNKKNCTIFWGSSNQSIKNEPFIINNINTIYM